MGPTKVLLEDGLGIALENDTALLMEGEPEATPAELAALAAADSYVPDVSDPTFVHPWEAFISGAPPGLPVPIPFPANFDKAKLVAWDREPIEYIDRKQLMTDDSSWQTHSGRPSNYWRYDDVENTFVLWPRPDITTWGDYVQPGQNSFDYSYTYDWEEPLLYLGGIGHLFTPEHSTEICYIFPWELEYLDGGECRQTGNLSRTTCFYDVGFLAGVEGMVTYLEDDTNTGTEAGAIVRRTHTLYGDSLYGVTTDVIDLDDNVLVIYRIIPTDIETDDDESDFHEYLRQYIEHGVLPSGPTPLTATVRSTRSGITGRTPRSSG